MIIVKGSIPVRMDAHEEAVALVETMAEASRQEPGCLAYEVSIRTDAPEVIMIWQQWTSIEALERHFASEHVDEFLDAIPDLVEGQVTSEQFDVRDMTPVEPADDAVTSHVVEIADNTILH